MGEGLSRHCRALLFHQQVSRTHERALGGHAPTPPSSKSLSRPLLHGARHPASTDDRSQPEEPWWAFTPQLNTPI